MHTNRDSTKQLPRGGKVNSWKNNQTIAKKIVITDHKENTSCLINFI